MTVVLIFLAVSFLSNFNKDKGKSPRVKCTAHLRLTALAFAVWSQDNAAQLNSNSFPMLVPESLGGSRQSIENGQMVQTFLAMTNQLHIAGILACPGDKKRKAADSFNVLTTRNISYFLAADINETNTHQILLGDRDLAVTDVQVTPGMLRLTNAQVVSWAGLIHGGGGNVALTDGSAHQVTTKSLRDLLQYSGFATNRLLVP